VRAGVCVWVCMCVCVCIGVFVGVIVLQHEHCSHIPHRSSHPPSPRNWHDRCKTSHHQQMALRSSKTAVSPCRPWLPRRRSQRQLRLERSARTGVCWAKDTRTPSCQCQSLRWTRCRGRGRDPQTTESDARWCDKVGTFNMCTYRVRLGNEWRVNRGQQTDVSSRGATVTFLSEQ
jgi:hypothetical protein